MYRALVESVKREVIPTGLGQEKMAPELSLRQ